MPRRSVKPPTTSTRVGVKDVAKRARVHFSTASRALDPVQFKRISHDVVERIRKAADELGYRPNANAAGLRTRKSRLIGFMVPDLSNPIFPPIFRGLEDRAAKSGYTALLANSDFDLAHEKRILNAFLARQIDGMIAATTRIADPVIASARSGGLPIVSVVRASPLKHVSSIIGDTPSGIGLLLDHLYSLGHRKIAAIVGPQDTSVGIEQLEAFHEAAAQKGIRRSDRRVVIAPAFSPEAGRAGTRKLLSTGQRPTAIMAGSDFIALGCLDVFGELRLSCPKDISLTGYNDTPYLDRINPALTTVRVPYYRMGYEAMEEMLRRIETPDAVASLSSLPVELVVRKSTRPPNRS